MPLCAGWSGTVDRVRTIQLVSYSGLLPMSQLALCRRMGFCPYGSLIALSSKLGISPALQDYQAD